MIRTSYTISGTRYVRVTRPLAERLMERGERVAVCRPIEEPTDRHELHGSVSGAVAYYLHHYGVRPHFYHLQPLEVGNVSRETSNDPA